MITTRRESECVVNEVEGTVTLRELLAYAYEKYEIWTDAPVLWDMSGGSLTEDESDYMAVRALVGNIHDLAEKRRGSRTAFLAPDPLTYGMLRMALTIAECVTSRSVAEIFRDREAAEAWLKQPGGLEQPD